TGVSAKAEATDFFRLKAEATGPRAEATGLPDTHEAEAGLPARVDERGQRGRLGRIVESGDGFAAGLLHQRVIAEQVADAQRRHARLGRTEKVDPRAHAPV